MTVIATVAATVSGVALTQWNANRRSAQEHIQARRTEQREVVLDVLEATAELGPKLNRLAALIDRASAGAVIDDLHAYYSPAYKEAVTQSNELLRAIIKAELTVTDNRITAALHELQSSAKELARVRHETAMAFENGRPDSRALRAMLAQHDSCARHLKAVTRQQLTL